MPLGLVSYGSSDSEESDNESENETQEPPKQKVVIVHFPGPQIWSLSQHQDF